GGRRGFCDPTGAGGPLGMRRWFAPRLGSGGFAPSGYGQRRGLGRFSYGGFPAGPTASLSDPISAGEERDGLRQQLAVIEEHLAEIRGRLQAADD
ncbi:DUF5320 domain-containing protein, partial [Candidatus Bipolaricaulota bacterium]|nr:DUF5320 domain-containing protein [Candidatus Bipolaricaulota bacterium]